MCDKPADFAAPCKKARASDADPRYKCVNFFADSLGLLTQDGPKSNLLLCRCTALVCFKYLPTHGGPDVPYPKTKERPWFRGAGSLQWIIYIAGAVIHLVQYSTAPRRGRAVGALEYFLIFACQLTKQVLTARTVTLLQA